MKNLIYIYFILLSVNGFSRGVGSYYKWVQKGESYITQNKFDSAVFCYKKSFEFNSPFSEDLRNAILSSYYGRKDSLDILLLTTKYLELQDISLDSILRLNKGARYKLLKKLTELSYWKNIKPMLDTVQPTFNLKYFEEVNKLFGTDQDIRTNKKYNFYSWDEQSLLWDIVDSLNLNRLLLINEKYGIFSEQNIGTTGFFCVYMIVFHNLKKSDTRANNKELYNLLLEGVKQGEIYNKTFAHLADVYLMDARNDTNHFFGKDCFYCQHTGFGNKASEYYFPNFNKIRIDKINNYRKEIFLDNYEAFVQKTGWMFLNRKNTMFSFGQLSFFDQDGVSFMKRKMEDSNIESYKFSKVE